MWPLVMYSNYFEIVSVTILILRTGLLRGMFQFNTLVIYYNDYKGSAAGYKYCS